MKKILALAMALSILGTALVGCGSSGDAASTTTESSSTTPAAGTAGAGAETKTGE